MLLAKANRNSRLKAARFFPFPRRPPPPSLLWLFKVFIPFFKPSPELPALTVSRLPWPLPHRANRLYLQEPLQVPSSDQTHHPLPSRSGVGEEGKEADFPRPPPPTQSSFLRALAQTCLFFLDTSSVSYSSSTPFSQHVNLIPSLPED